MFLPTRSISEFLYDAGRTDGDQDRRRAVEAVGSAKVNKYARVPARLPAG